MVDMRAEFVDSVARHGRNLQTFEQCLRIVLCVYNVKKTENPTTREMWSVICFLNAKNMKPAEIHHQLCDVYGEYATSSSMVWRWVRLFNEGRKNVHDDPRSSRSSVVNEDLVRAVEEKIRENRWFTITSLSPHFPPISRSLLHEIVCMLGAKDTYGRTQIEMAGQCVGLSDKIQWGRQ